MVVRDNVAMKCAFGENPKRVYREKKDVGPTASGTFSFASSSTIKWPSVTCSSVIKDADLVITDGCPFEVSTKVRHVFIEGKEVQ